MIRSLAILLVFASAVFRWFFKQAHSAIFFNVDCAIALLSYCCDIDTTTIVLYTAVPYERTCVPGIIQQHGLV